MFRAAFVLLIGGIPAAIASCFALLVAVLGLVFFWTDLELHWLVFTINGILGMLGTIAIWFAAFKRTNPVVVLGLIGGLFAIGATWTDDTVGVFRIWPSPIGEYFTFGPVAVATGLLIESTIEYVERIRKRLTDDQRECNNIGDVSADDAGHQI